MKVSHALPVIQSQIDKLEAAGFKVRLSHAPQLNGTCPSGAPYKGVTAMSLEKIFDGTMVHAKGAGYCGLKDQWCRARGTQAAFNRAVHDLSTVMGRAGVKRILG